MRYQGRITMWKDHKGFGFIDPNGGGDRVFVHIKSFANSQRRPEGNELVTYELASDERGRPQARAVAFVGERWVPPRAAGRSNFPLLLAAGFLIVVAAAVFLGRLPKIVFPLYLGTSIVAFIAYAIDKSAARRDAWRIPESTLHLLALACGWPGALTAQRLLRHKSAKASFQFTFWVTVTLNCGALGWLLSPYSARLLRNVTGFA